MRFYPNSLLSKWGFHDGDILDDIAWDNKIEVDHDALIRIVKKYVIPKIKNKIKVFEIGTIHNPIRAESVDGKDIDCYNGSDIKLDPEYVDVEDSIILKEMERFK